MKKTNSLPLVSIGLPTYNKGHLLKNAVKSLLFQNYLNIEIIISDNASTDETKKICLEFCKTHKSIVYIRQKRNYGAINNFNSVLKHAHGKYFMWASDDDSWDKKYIRYLVEKLENNSQCILALSDFSLSNKAQKFVYRINTTTVADSIEAIKKITVNPNYISAFFYGLYRRNSLVDIGGCPKLHQIADPITDLVLVFKILLTGKIAYIPSVLFHKNDTGNYIDKYTELYKLNFSNEINRRIIRYLNTPIMLTLLFYYQTSATITSKFTLANKFRIYLYVGISFITGIIKFCVTTFKGLLYILFGSLKTFFEKYI